MIRLLLSGGFQGSVHACPSPSSRSGTASAGCLGPDSGLYPALAVTARAAAKPRSTSTCCHRETGLRQLHGRSGFWLPHWVTGQPSFGSPGQASSSVPACPADVPQGATTSPVGGHGIVPAASWALSAARPSLYLFVPEPMAAERSRTAALYRLLQLPTQAKGSNRSVARTKNLPSARVRTARSWSGELAQGLPL